MFIPLIILCFQTILLWIVVATLHKQKNRITLIPLYAFIAILTIITQNFSDLGFAVTINGWYFLIASFSYFTPLMFAVLLLYLFEGPRAARSAYWIILSTTIFYVFIIYITGLMTNTTNWVTITPTQLTNHFWSLLAFTFDIFFMAVFWELLSKIKSLPLLAKIFLITIFVLTFDTVIFTTGAFGTTELYFPILKGNLINRFFLSVIASIFITFSLKSRGFTEESRDKPKSIWEILNFHSDLEVKIKKLEKTISDEQALKQKIIESQETFKLAIDGSGAGVWDWNIITNEIFWSPKFYTLLEYSDGEIEGTLDAFKKILHHDDTDKTFKLLDNCFKTKTPYEIEYRLKTKSGEYKWFMANGIAKFDDNNKAIRMVGSIIDINSRKIAEIELANKVDQLTQLNNLMVGREIKMTELKEEISRLKK